MKQRIISVDILKCVAAVLITWSHLEPCLGDYAYLATGGAIGNALFFFCSGFTLFVGRRGKFFDWYKRRIARIYPTVFTWTLLSSAITGCGMCMKDIILSGGGWFVSCIMLFYIPCYFITKCRNTYLLFIMAFSFVCCFASSFMIELSDFESYYKWNWSFYFIAMVFGGMLGKKYARHGMEKEVKPFVALLIALLGVICYYIIMFVSKQIQMPILECMYILPLIGVCYALYRLCNCSRMIMAMNIRWFRFCVMSIGALCLEIYIVQPSLLTDKLNNIFPINIIVVYLVIIVVAYGLHCASQIWRQTFSKENYNWRAMIKLY